MKWVLVVGIFLLQLGIVSAATVHGSVYDFSLDVIEGAQIEVNSSPTQKLISKAEGYSFELSAGVYELVATYQDESGISKEVQEIIITEDGNYVNDLILIPDFEAEEFGEFELGDIEQEQPSYWLWVYLALFLAGLGVYLLLRKKATPGEAAAEGELEEILAIIKRQGGRTTQKDIRKETPLSEAKVSLMITELEHKGKIEKIKKGRGNVIVLK